MNPHFKQMNPTVIKELLRCIGHKPNRLWYCLTSQCTTDEMVIKSINAPSVSNLTVTTNEGQNFVNGQRYLLLTTTYYVKLGGEVFYVFESA